ncbi:MAG: UDP-N-acetylmuramoyl-L-alanine--D-glutamate ligase [Christensenellaceae bacterium]|nr:UDP-N-acetylmuramoyl-L-alanine--D-glutamate ligase [Christensenellaceae bacterium]
MRNTEKYAGKRVLVVGMARSGVAAAQLLVKAGAKVVVNDNKTKEQLGDAVTPLESLPVEWALGRPAGELLDGIDALVISPGIPDTAGFVVEAKKRGVYVTGELEMAHQLSSGEMVAVTGTNGKTTTVSLLGEIFRNAGRVTHVVGNIGYPYSAAGLDSKNDDMFVCEVSSFQMETAETFHPRAAALLNITEDHLNRHGTMECYTATKMRMFAQQTAEDTAVFNADDPALEPLTGQVKSRVMLFSRKREVAEGAFVREGKLVTRWNGEEREVCGVEEIRIPGPHNLENALAAACVATAMGVPAPVIRHSLRTFAGVEHRIEFVRELEGVRYINDSKGTNVDSTIKAVQTMTQPTAIILGGYDKHCDFTPLIKEMLASPHIREAVLIGATADQIERTCRECGYDRLHRAATLEEAVDTCRALASEGWNVLLSPACASFDMFADYEARGRIFKEIVKALK